ncbi:unnamed protein product [Closterium sp. Naga37s-1]|nr:unnamed protein product [Closterium sp. Naga37s-1]
MSQEVRAMRRLQQQLQLRGVTVDRAALQSVVEYVLEAGCSEQQAVDDLLRGITALERTPLMGVQVVSRDVVRQVLLQPLRARSRAPPADAGGTAGGSSRGEHAGGGARPDALGGVGRNGGAGEVMEGGRGEAVEGWMREWRALVVIDGFSMARVDYDPLRKHFSRSMLPAPPLRLWVDRAYVLAVTEMGVVEDARAKDVQLTPVQALVGGTASSQQRRHHVVGVLA